MPGEEKTFSQYFIPYRDFGVGKNANKEAMGPLEFQEGNAVIQGKENRSLKRQKKGRYIGRLEVPILVSKKSTIPFLLV